MCGGSGRPGVKEGDGVQGKQLGTERHRERGEMRLVRVGEMGRWQGRCGGTRKEQVMFLLQISMLKSRRESSQVHQSSHALIHLFSAIPVFTRPQI